MKKILTLSMFIPLLLCGCNNKSSDVKDELTITLNATSLTLSEEKTYQLEAYFSDGSNKEITWSVRDEDIASVSSTGLVTALLTGSTQIYAKYEEAIAVCSLKVTPFEPNPTLSIEMNQTSFALYVGDEFPISKTVRFGKDEIKEYTSSYKVANGSIASIENDTIKALAVGETTAIISISYLEETVEQLINITVL